MQKGLEKDLWMCVCVFVPKCPKMWVYYIGYIIIKS